MEGGKYKKEEANFFASQLQLSFSFKALVSPSGAGPSAAAKLETG